MNFILKCLYVLPLLTRFSIMLTAQTISYDASRPELKKIEPYQLAVTYDKTTHLIFPSRVRYVDLGSGYIIAGKAEGVENVLRVKAAIDGFKVATNFSVITDNGRFYNFNVNYDKVPLTLNYDLTALAGKPQNNTALFPELGTATPRSVDKTLSNIYRENKKNLYYGKSRSYGIQFSLKGIYIKDHKLYFHTELKNKTNIPYLVDFIHFKIVDKKMAKRTVSQQQIVTPLREYQPFSEIKGQSAIRNVFLLDQFTLADDKILLIEIFEKNGGRHQVLKVKNSDLVKASLIKNLGAK
ncbi:conjugative transposon protein TraN [Niabella insulamsoli]|uniref:conjugative transposon protein TraN n=1 Tax=Niabella insulamsoli TaxID=3144874 RepID=UPI00320400A7